jgi:hypothetical protein
VVKRPFRRKGLYGYLYDLDKKHLNGIVSRLKHKLQDRGAKARPSARATVAKDPR